MLLRCKGDGVLVSIAILINLIPLAILWGLGVYALILLIKALKIYINKNS
ncbi:hypothetical protein B0P06_005291 [Clostridium saccharoperbutylacetonicum]|nr:hypothetical protein [Clostridium saccharoperbutylacetonicum]NSB45520.1 hypothetical protein [Clostridium saccharoperbutylacetonicum]